MLRHLALIAALTLATPAAAEDTITERHHAEAVRMMELSGASAMIEPMVQQIASIMMPMLKQQFPDAIVDDYNALMLAAFSREKGSLLAALAMSHARRFSEEELQEINAFMESDLGRKMVLLQPEIMAESNMIGEAWAQRIIPDVMEELISLHAPSSTIEN